MDPQPHDDAIVVPLPRKAPDGDIEIPPHAIPEQVVWRYDGTGKRTQNWTFSGDVRYVSGAEGDRLHGELNAVIHDLLDWAMTQERAEQPDEREAA
ncbi:hypothetical protein SK803_37075 [Lentzea sp. BCCO 10_0856]|uniref:YD repeat-containing protein n=1 Tax=Lentzea miocenica TaxID=3095431 RepID=A0ABU4TD70_9PSEU|nr:hypothetical protein [Lentzea sp. BCCO 10_0856]MDX8035843.1 hypothetical protein [Lentzea sp. BCCO 10_0856]